MQPETRDLVGLAARIAADLPESVRAAAPVPRHHGKLDFTDSYLDYSLYRGAGKNIESIGDQINACYEYGLYDGCAVLSRRLIEMLLIFSFKHLKIEQLIKGSDGHYLMLSGIIAEAVQNATLDLERTTKKYLNTVVERGHLSAHKPTYSALKRDLDEIRFHFRVIVEELLHKAGKR